MSDWYTATIELRIPVSHFGEATDIAQGVQKNAQRELPTGTPNTRPTAELVSVERDDEEHVHREVEVREELGEVGEDGA